MKKFFKGEIDLNNCDMTEIGSRCVALLSSTMKNLNDVHSDVGEVELKSLLTAVQDICYILGV